MEYRAPGVYEVSGGVLPRAGNSFSNVLVSNTSTPATYTSLGAINK